MRLVLLLSRLIQALFPVLAQNGKQGKCGHTCPFFKFFPAAKIRKTACWGASPNPALRANLARSHRGLSALFASWRCCSISLFFCSSVRPNRRSIFALTVTSSRISVRAARYSAYSAFLSAVSRAASAFRASIFGSFAPASMRRKVACAARYKAISVSCSLKN